jgi:cytosine/adenosine deaminase-related metal-dependent hydrolase
MLLSNIIKISWSISAVEATSILFTGGTIITFDEQAQGTIVRHNTSVFVVGDTITDITTNGQPDNIPADVDIVSAEGMILSPGFIDTHRHTWQTTHRTIASNTSLAEYFVRYSPFSQVLSLFSTEDYYLSQMVGLYEALNAGVTSLLDHAHNIASEDDANTALNAYLESRARIFFAYNFDLVGNFSVPSRAAHFKELKKDARLPGSAVTMGISCDSWSSFNQTDLQIVIGLLR